MIKLSRAQSEDDRINILEMELEEGTNKFQGPGKSKACCLQLCIEKSEGGKVTI